METWKLYSYIEISSSVLTIFANNKSTKDGLHWECSTCKNEIDKLSNKILPEKILVYVSAHGSELDSEHFILTDISQFGHKATQDRIFFYTKDLFNLLANVIE